MGREAMADEREEAGWKQFLEAKVAEQEAQIASLKEQLEQLKRQKGISSARDGLTFNSKTGTHVDQAAKHYCTTCLSRDQRWELKVEPHGWRCMICKKYYSDPDRPEVVDHRPDSWMT